MFCTKCGKEQSEGAKFCEFCGNDLNAAVGSQAKKEADNEVICHIKPTFKFFYESIGVLILIIVLIIAFGSISIATEDGSILMAAVIISIMIFILFAIGLWIKSMQYKAYNYNFYKTKVIYRDSFLNLSEKEVKYRHIKETVMYQSFIQRFFNIGTIIMYTNAESGFSNGIFIRSVYDVKDVFKRLKDIVNEGD
jgi:membrane protein YdbS with pleckstrin-like domain